MSEDMRVTQSEVDAANKTFKEDEQGRLLALKAYGERLNRIGFSEAWKKFAEMKQRNIKEVTNEDLR